METLLYLNLSVQPFRLLALPPEIQDMIYEATQEKNRLYLVPSLWSVNNHFDPALRLASRQLSSEATAVIYNTTTFNYKMEFNPDVEKPDLLNTLTEHATKFRIAIMPSLIARWPADSTTLLPLCSHFQHTMALDPWGSFYRLAIQMRDDIVQKKLVCLLRAMRELHELEVHIVGDLVTGCKQVPPTMRLDGLRVIKGLRKVKIYGCMDQDCARSLEKAMEAPI
ncbi:MAG: hypothetical protein M1836_001129 [Candelina mexicana]|nr:MAG: hypothetical protein M1836_001129 [Candelina mexicana]